MSSTDICDIETQRSFWWIYTICFAGFCISLCVFGLAIFDIFIAELYPRYYTIYFTHIPYYAGMAGGVATFFFALVARIIHRIQNKLCNTEVRVFMSL